MSLAGVLSLLLIGIFVGPHRLMSGLALLLIEPLFLVLLFPWWTVRRVLAPLGLVRTAYVVGQLARYSWSGDRHGGGIVAAASALGHRPAGDDQAAHFVETRIAQSQPLRAGAIVGAALCAAYRGDRLAARHLLRSVLDLPAAHVARMALPIAAEWLAGDAVERGDWAEVLALGRTSAPRSRATRLLGALAARLLGNAPVPSDRQLLTRWLLSPRRLALFPLVERALATTRLARDQRPHDPFATPTTDDALADALSLHVRVVSLSSRAVTTADLCQLGASWDRVRRDASLQARIEERARQLGIPNGRRAIDRLLLDVVDDLALLAHRGEVPLDALDAAERPPCGETIGAAMSRLDNTLLEEIELAAGAIKARATAERPLPGIDEWQTWHALRQMCERTARIGGLRLRRQVFSSVHGAAGKLAVWLWNARNERLIAHAMFQWLLGEALAIGDERAAELQRKNVACGV